MILSLEQSFKTRLRKIAKERDLTPSEVWQNVISERFLVRLCNSPYHSHFVLKGGALLAKRVEIGRETQDLDFSIVRLSNEVSVLQRVLEEIIAIEANDGFIFTNPKVSPLEHFHMQYPGAQVKINVNFGKSRFPLLIDLGFGDLVEVHEQKILLLGNSKGPLFEPSVTLKCYPLEFIFAEKLETIVYRGRENSRMKDFHDLYTLISTEKAINKLETKDAVSAVFNHRNTHLKLPINFDDLELEALQIYWLRYLQMTKAGNIALPTHVGQVIDIVNKWLDLDI